MTDRSPICIAEGTLVQVFFKNGTSLEGVVVDWNKDNAILQAPGGVNNILIYYPSENLLMVKIINFQNQTDSGEKILSAKPAAKPRAPDSSNQKSAPNPPEPKDVDARTKQKVQSHLEDVREQKMQLTNRLRNTAPKNMAPQVERYQAPWGVKS